MLLADTIGLLGPDKRPKLATPMIYAAIEGCLAAAIPVLLVVMLLTDLNFGARSLTIMIVVVGVTLIARYFVGKKAMLEGQLRGAAYIRDARMAIGEHLRLVPLGFFQRFRAGDLTSRLMSNLQDVETVITHLYTDIVTAATTAVIVAGCLLIVDWRLALITLVVIPTGLPILWLTNKIFRSTGRQRYTVAGEMNDAFVEFLSGIRTLKAHNMALEKLDVLKGAIDRSMWTSIKLEATMAPIILAFQVLMDVGLMATLLVGISYLSGHSLDASDFLAVAFLSFIVYRPIKSISLLQAELRNSQQAGHTIGDILREPTQSWIDKDVNVTAAEIRGLPALQFDGVTFSYDGGNRAVQDMSFTVENGSVVALVGASGSGKTTAANLAMRLWDVDEGRITYEGRDIATIKPETLLSHMGVVFQDVYLFHDTVRANIAIAKDGASDAEVEAAARAAKAHDFIMELPQGYDTVLAEGGASLSGGEKQRIAIARCILKDAPFIILDEATASLDPENERDIQEALARLLIGRTVLVIAHRLKTVKAADHIVVLDEGRPVESGSHDELIARDGAYARMWRNQEESAGWSLKR